VAELTGADFRARVRLSTKADETLADVGATCERVPVASLPGLLASRKIEPARHTVSNTVLLYGVKTDGNRQIDAALTDLGQPADPEPAP
jgi:hypothetical protein